ncbi:substrate-binding domain-containing protein [Desulfogranum mediterraneum]|uniref:substrate-binding domain-containing protein n=1 Tax=Desulfogranum mediterraneum TaxID=160661 RepID=UPI0003FD8C91|nr:substrate-binding domain-containing protein [Desulfogranum mediterraneum]
MKLLQLILAAALTLALSGTSGLANEKVIKMSTTTSTQASGLLDVLLPALEKDTGIQVKVIAKGTGAAIRDGRDGNVDVIFVHAKNREQAFVAEGYGTKRYAVMHNDFVILGPQADGARIKGMKEAVPALKQIADSHSLFISRGDDSGTHTKEQALWKATGLQMETVTSTVTKKGKSREISFTHPAGLGQWYLSVGQGMGKTLTIADEKQAYTLADRGTYLKYKYGREIPIDLEILSEGDPKLANPYGVIPINPKRHPHVNYQVAKEFAQWLVSARGQAVIGGYRLLGKQLFYPDAVQ